MLSSRWRLLFLVIYSISVRGGNCNERKNLLYFRDGTTVTAFLGSIPVSKEQLPQHGAQQRAPYSVPLARSLTSPSRKMMANSSEQDHIGISLKNNIYGSNTEKHEDLEVSAVKGRSSSKVVLSGCLASSSALLFGLGAFGLLPGYAGIDDLFMRDFSSCVTVLALAFGFVKISTLLYQEGFLPESKDSRKLVHTLSAPLFILCWPLFSAASGARYFAALVPSMNALRLILAAETNRGDEENELATALSRTGNPKEALGGPLVYVIVMILSSLLFWRDSVAGVVAMSTMAAGDGMADVIGRRFGKNNKWFFNKDKSVAGSTAFVLASFLTTVGLISWLTSQGSMILNVDFHTFMLRTIIISVVSAMVELLPSLDDNWSVPISAAAMAAFFFP